MDCSSRHHHLVRPVDQRVPIHGPGEQGLPVIGALPERLRVGGEVGDRIDEAVSVLPDIRQVRCVIVSRPQVFPHLPDVAPLLGAAVLHIGDQGADELCHLAVRKLHLSQLPEILS